MKHIKKMKIDIDKKNFEVIPSVQYDSNTRFLHINLLNGAVPFNLSGCSVKISGTKPDGTAIFNNCTVINAKEGFIEVVLTEQMNATPGTVKCELKLYSGSGVLTTKHFEIEVTASVTSKNVTSGNEFKALEEALSKVNNIDTKFESLTAETVARATEQEIRKQIASGNMANLTMANNSVDGEKLKDETVTKDKLDPNIKFGIADLDDDVLITTGGAGSTGINLFDKNKGEYGYFNTKQGKVLIGQDGNINWTSDYIACSPGETIRKDNNSSNKDNDQDVGFFTKDKQYISGIILKKTENWKTFKIPENAYYFRFDMLTEYKDTEKIYGKRGGSSSEGNLQQTVLSDGIKVKGENIIDLEVGLKQLGGDIITKNIVFTNEENLFDKTKGEYGYFNTKQGKVLIGQDGNINWTSDYIACSPGETIRKDNNSSNKDNDQDVGFFTKDKQYISGIILKKTENWKTFIIPENAYFFRFDMLTEYKDTEKIYAKRSADGDVGITTYQLSDGIKIKKSNILGMEDDDSTKEQISLYNEDGVKYLLTIDSDGELLVRPSRFVPPSNFNAFTTTGKSCMKGDILVTPHTEDNNLGWLLILDSNLNVKKYKQLTSFAYNFRRCRNSAGDIRYIYAQTVNTEHPKMAMNGGYDNTKLVVADKNLEILHEYKLKAYGTVPEGHPGENHEIIYFDDNHYMLLAYVASTVSNIPGKNGSYKALNCVIQEVKNGEVVFHWESIKHIETYQYSCFNKEFNNYPSTQNVHNDYFHMNGFMVDPLNPDHILVSARHLGLLKIQKSTGEILWMFGRGGRIDFTNMTEAQTPYLQHNITRLGDGSIICFDNSGCSTNNVRICRYWLDEKTMTMTRFTEYKTNHPRSAHMGSVQFVREGVFLINYGGAYRGLTWEEYDFNINQQNCSFKFNDGTDCYRVWKDI